MNSCSKGHPCKCFCIDLFEGFSIHFFRIFPSSLYFCSVVAWLKIELHCEKKYCNCACKMFASGFGFVCVAQPKNTVRRTIVARKCLLLHLLLLVYLETEVHRIAVWGENLLLRYVCFCIFCCFCCSTEELCEKIYLQRCGVFWTIHIHVQWTSLSKLRNQSVTINSGFEFSAFLNVFTALQECSLHIMHLISSSKSWDPC